MPVLSCLRPAADAPVAMDDEDDYPTARRARAFSRLVDAPAHDTSDFASTATTHKRYITSEKTRLRRLGAEAKVCARACREARKKDRGSRAA